MNTEHTQRMTQLTHRVGPWLAGVGMAGGQAGLATRCTVTTQGVCSACGSCAVVVASLVSWALLTRKQARQGLQAPEDTREH